VPATRTPAIAHMNTIKNWSDCISSIALPLFSGSREWGQTHGSKRDIGLAKINRPEHIA